VPKLSSPGIEIEKEAESPASVKLGRSRETRESRSSAFKMSFREDKSSERRFLREDKEKSSEKQDERRGNRSSSNKPAFMIKLS
jgi:hypothetical protein